MANKKVSQLTSKPSVLVTDLFPIADPSTGQLYKTTISDLGTAIGSGVSSVNTLVGAVVLDTDDIQELVSPTNKWFTDTRARAALSASSPLAYNSGTGVFSMPQASGSQNGYLSSTDWTTFNAKQTALSGTGFVKISGTTISYDNSTYLTTSAAASTYLALGGGTMTGALLGTSAGFTGYVGIGNTSPLYQLDVTGSGRFEGDLHILSTNPRIYLTDSDNNPDYFISNTDGTFTVYDVTNSASRLTISSSQISPRLPIVSNSSIQGTAFYSDSFFSATTFVTANNYFLTGMTSGSGALYYSSGSNRVTVANYNTSGTLHFEVNGGIVALTLNADKSATFGAGGSFAGDLSGTSATFSSTITSSRNDSGNISATLQNAFINQGNLLNFIHNSGGSTTNGFIGHGGDSTGNFVIINNGITALSLARSSGAATFSSSVTATQGIFTGSDAERVRMTRTSIGSWDLAISGTNRFSIYDVGGAAERISITSAGHTLFGTTGTSWTNTAGTYIFYQSALNVTRDGAEAMNVNRLSSNGDLIKFYQAGTNVGSISVTGSLTSYNVTSDYRLKEDLKSIKGLEIVNKIKVYDYKWKSDNSRMDGVLAHELQEVLPYAVQGVKDGEQMQSVDYSKIVPVLIQSIKELKSKIETLENK